MTCPNGTVWRAASRLAATCPGGPCQAVCLCGSGDPSAECDCVGVAEVSYSTCTEAEVYEAAGFSVAGSAVEVPGVVMSGAQVQLTSVLCGMFALLALAGIFVTRRHQMRLRMRKGGVDVEISRTLMGKASECSSGGAGDDARPSLARKVGTRKAFFNPMYETSASIHMNPLVDV